MLGVIIVARLHDMYQRSRAMLIYLVIILLVVNISSVVLAAIIPKYYVTEEGILFGIHMCVYDSEGNIWFLFAMSWILPTVWEVLALCLSVRMAVKHFRDLRRLGPSTGSTIGDCLRVLIQSHVFYFASFAGVSCLQFIVLSPSLLSTVSESEIFDGARSILLVVQMFVLGPRLILSVREYHAKLVAGSDADTSMNSIVFQEHVHISTSGTV
ncbi:hypothetical protein CY34DRAFT_613544 [Suillus luteus UH-Slu-Lm8-n1]|uniref:Uncharacterized protein n=1 Tax=Suillus luteus UH-Slu-Lm8-n1 TaxID=930992 RepID=A0A0D0A9K6_9AGAM|nr:hypothetical protein CY34DRAFT_613544 [Suillus luteus UH-Slu-Lm8-n1]